MLSVVEKGSNLMYTRLTLVATLIDTKQQSTTTSFSTKIVCFRDICVIVVMHENRVISVPKEQILGKSYQRNRIHLHWTKPKTLVGYSQDVTAGIKPTLQNITNKVVYFYINIEFSSDWFSKAYFSILRWLWLFGHKWNTH